MVSQGRVFPLLSLVSRPNGRLWLALSPRSPAPGLVTPRCHICWRWLMNASVGRVWTLSCTGHWNVIRCQESREGGNNGVRKYIRPSSHWAFMMLLELGLQHNWLCKSVKIASSNTSCWIKFWNYFGSKFPMAWRALRIWIWSKVLWGKWLKFCLPRKVS